MVEPLESAFEKVRWANSHLKQFEARKRRFVNSRAYRVKSEYANREEREWVEMTPDGFRAVRDAIPSGYRMDRPVGAKVSILKREYVRFSLDVVRPIPQTAWAVMVGNIVHNLRSALDILVWELSIKHQASLPNGLPPPIEPLPLDSKWRRSQFPIVTKDTKWKGECADRLRLVDPALHADFERLQPWYTGKQSGRPPEDEWLAVLQELWNRDKHRGVSFIAANVALSNVTLRSGPDGPPLASFTPREIEHTPFGPVEHGAPLGLWAFDANVSYIGKLNVGVYSHLTFNVMLAKGSPAEGRSITDVIETLIDTVTTILRQFLPKLV